MGGLLEQARCQARHPQRPRQPPKHLARCHQGCHLPWLLCSRQGCQLVRSWGRQGQGGQARRRGLCRQRLLSWHRPSCRVQGLALVHQVHKEVQGVHGLRVLGRCLVGLGHSSSSRQQLQGPSQGVQPSTLLTCRPS